MNLIWVVLKIINDFAVKSILELWWIFVAGQSAYFRTFYICVSCQYLFSYRHSLSTIDLLMQWKYSSPLENF